jgi:voltage-gated potassium channel
MVHRHPVSILDPDTRTAEAKAFRLVHHAALVLGVAAALETTLSSVALPRALLIGFQLLVAVLFIGEWVMRLAFAPLLSVPRGQPGARRLYLLSFLGLVDFLCGWSLPAALLLGVSVEHVGALGVLWTLKLTRYIPGFTLIGRVLNNERNSLLSVLAAFVIILLLAATIEYLIEGTLQPEAFGSLPAALWWCIVTLTTTGYGDAVPATALGRAVAGLVMILGIAVFALWAGILASGFAAEVRRRDFLRTWGLVAKVPLFRALGAAVIADVARLLRPLQVAAGATLVRKGDPGDCMYFIVEGEVEIELEPRPVRLVGGDFLGEMALITGEPRRATATALSRTQLLSLDIADFRTCAGQHPELTRAIETEAMRRGVGALPTA